MEQECLIWKYPDAVISCTSHVHDKVQDTQYDHCSLRNMPLPVILNAFYQSRYKQNVSNRQVKTNSRNKRNKSAKYIYREGHQVTVEIKKISSVALYHLFI